MVIRINARLVSGNTTEIFLDRSRHVYDLKKNIERVWQIEASDQTLVCGTQVLEETHTIGSLAAHDVTVIVFEWPNKNQIKELIDCIFSSEDSPSRFAAVADLVQTVDRSDERALWYTLDRLCSGLHRASVNGKRGALEGLAQLAPTGHDPSIAAACHMLKDTCAFVRSSAATTIEILAPRGHEHALFQVLKIIRESNSVAQVDALSCLGSIAPKETEDKQTFDQVMKLLGMRMEHVDAEVRSTAGNAVTSML